MGKMLAGLGFFCSMSLMTHLASAQIDPDPNGIGLYFDEEATIYCLQAPVGSELTAYLCLTRITAASGVSRWEATIEVSYPSAVLTWNLRGQAVNATEIPEFVVQLADPLPWQPSLVVLEMRIRVMTEHPLAFRIHPVSDPSVTDTLHPLPAYAAGTDPTDFRTLGYSWGWDPVTGTPFWCAVINPVGDCSEAPAEREPSSWGTIKALYRGYK